LIDLDTVLVSMANAVTGTDFPRGTDKELTVTFPKACVRTVVATGIGGAAPAAFGYASSSSIKVTAHRVGAKSWEIYHCAG
jgi:hypothetical protein